jgi:hypothetical protein
MPLNVQIELGTVRLKDKQPSTETEGEPYLWTVFFKIDDANRSGDPIATVVGPPGSHGNLGVGEVSAPAVIRVPQSIGRWETGLTRLPVRPGTINGRVGAIVGVVAILMEEDHVSDDGAEAGRLELIKQVQKAMDAIAADLVSAINFEPADLVETIQSKVIEAIKAQQNILENIWSLFGPDDFIGAMVWHAWYDDLADSSTPLTFSEVWEIFREHKIVVLGGEVDLPDILVSEWSLDGQARTFTESRPRFSTTALNFGSVQSGLVRSRGFTIWNFTSQDLSLVLTKTGSQAFHCTSAIDVPQSTQAGVNVTFSPVGPGAASGSVAVKSRDSSATIATISLSGSTPAGRAP